MIMSAPSGFLDCFLKFLRGEEGEKLMPPIKRGRAALYRPPKSKAEGSSSECENNECGSDRCQKTPKVKDKIEKEKDEKSKSKDVSSSAVVPAELDTSDNKGNSPSSNYKERDVMKEERVAEGVNVCVNDNVGEGEGESNAGGLNTVKVNIENIGENSLMEKMEVDKHSIKDVGENQNAQKAKDIAVEEEMGSDKKGICFGDVCSAKNKQNSVISSSSASNQTKEVGKDVSDATTDNTVGELRTKGKKRKQKTIVQVEVPRRELSSRKAKEKAMFTYIESESEEDMPGLDEHSDSDNDPVWVPNEKKASSDEESSYNWSGRPPSNWKAKKSHCNSPIAYSSKQKEDKKESIVEIKKKNEKSQSKTSNVSNSERKAKAENGVPAKTLSNTTKSTEAKNLFYQHTSQMPFQSGSFIALKKDLEELEEPTIWRVDGKALLQKYEPFRGDNDCLRYRNVSTYSGWGPKNTALYQAVPVKFIQQNRFETIVEIIQEQLVINEDKLLEKLIKDYEKHGYAYEVYLQTLVSQALDSNFLREIVAEKDEYFITSMDEMDNVCEEKKTKLLQSCGWSRKLKESLITWPIITMTPKNDDSTNTNCEVCCKITNYMLVKMEGQPYCNKTLEYSTPSENSFKCKVYFACKTCSENIALFSKIVHLKHNTYNDCAKLVSEKKASDPSKDNTTILHDILADGAYITEKFQEVSLLWAHADLKARRTTNPEEIIL